MKEQIKENLEQELILNFGGFYGSIHEDQIESIIECLHDDEDEDDNKNQSFLDEIDYEKTWINYSWAYVNKIEEFLKENNLKIDIDFIKLESPRYYNYSTDIIIVKILDLEHQKKLIDYVKKNYHKELIELIEDSTTKRSGYIPFYCEDEVLSNKDNKLIEASLEIISDKMIEAGDLPFEVEIEINN